jgi:hypothetical protein
MMTVRRLAIVSFLVLSAFATAWIGESALVPRVGDGMARAMGVAAERMAPRERVGARQPDTEPTSTPEAVRSDAARPPGGRSHRRADRERPPAAIDISRDQVARLRASQLRAIFATDAFDASGHAQGARLHGVAALGVGLAEGDVVTSIDGGGTANVGDATAAALGAFASGEATAHATVLRRGRVIRVTVHIPAREPASGRTPRVEMGVGMRP